MKKAMAIIIGLGLCVAASSAYAETMVLLGELGHFTGPEELDLEGDFVKAVNFGGPDNILVDGITFTSDAGDPEVVGSRLTGWSTRPEFGDTADDDNLEQIMHDIRFAVGTNVEAHIAVEAGRSYKLQLLFYGNRPADNRFADIEIEGLEAVDEVSSLGLDTDVYDVGRSVVYTHTLTAGDNTLDVRMGTIFGGNMGGDRNPIWQALTLELLPIPEPSTGLLLLLGSLGVSRIRRRRAQV